MLRDSAPRDQLGPEGGLRCEKRGCAGPGGRESATDA